MERPNPNIAKLSGGKPYSRRLMVQSIANAKLDDKFSPLATRLPLLIAEIKAYHPDMLVLLESGCPSQGMAFVELAAQIEVATGLEFVCIYRINANKEFFAKSLFVDPTRIMVIKARRVWTRGNGSICDGDHFGNDILAVTVSPVDDLKQVYDRELTFGAVHFPLSVDGRLQVAQWLADHNDMVDHISGDTNCFMNIRGQDQLDILETAYISTLPADTGITYRDFDYNFKIFADDRIPSTAVVIGPGPEPNTSKILFEGWLDRAYQSKTTSITSTSFAGPLTGASDHAPVITDFTL